MALVRKGVGACGRHGMWLGAQAVAIAAERLQLNLLPSICSQLQPILLDGGIGITSRQSHWHAPQWAPPCISAAAAASSARRPAPVRWHSTSAEEAAASTKKPSSSISSSSSSSSSLLEAFSRAGWSRQEVLNMPNGLSMLRLLSGPVIASWIIQGQWQLALPTLAISGATDWADGYVAKNYNQRSVLGSYLDPLADKTLMCSVIAALGYTGALSVPMVALILGRDVFLVAGAFAARAKELGWRWPGAGEFFRLAPAAAGSSGSTAIGATEASPSAAPLESGEQQQGGQSAAAAGGGEAGNEAPAAPFVEPLYISKVNTCFQLALAGAAMGHAWLGVPGELTLWYLAAGTAGTTVWSCAAYVRAYMAGNLLTAGKQA